MDYNDFPILTDEQYNFLQTKFENFSSPFNRKETVLKFFNELIECKMSLPFIKEQTNYIIKKSLNAALKKFESIISNLNATFNFSINTSATKEINIFCLLKKISNLIKINVFWANLEQKEYFKHYSLKILNELSIILYDILSALQNSQINIFKFM